MQDVSSRYAGVHRLATVFMVLGLLGAAALIGVGGMWLRGGEPPDVRAGVALLIAGGWTVLGVVLVRGLISLGVKANLNLYRIHDALLDVNDQIKSYDGKLSEIVANSEISDAAKSIAHRAKERETLRAAIREEISLEDWDLAYALLDEEERRFGDTSEASRLRAQVDEARRDRMEEEVDQIAHEIERHCEARHWDRAKARAAACLRRFPESEHVSRLPAMIEERRTTYKNHLLERWHEAVGRKDIDGGIDILREIDPYLSPAEAKQLEESARGVFHEKLMNMRVQLSLAVKERRWRDAVQVGESIIDEFPNSRMAREVTDSMDTLRARADGKRVSSVIAKSGQPS